MKISKVFFNGEVKSHKILFTPKLTITRSFKNNKEQNLTEISKTILLKKGKKVSFPFVSLDLNNNPDFISESKITGLKTMINFSRQYDVDEFNTKILNFGDNFLTINIMCL